MVAVLWDTGDCLLTILFSPSSVPRLTIAAKPQLTYTTYAVSNRGCELLIESPITPHTTSSPVTCVEQVVLPKAKQCLQQCREMQEKLLLFQQVDANISVGP